MRANKMPLLGRWHGEKGAQGTASKANDTTSPLYSAACASGSPWAVDNTAGMHPEGLAVLRQMNEEAIAGFGPDPCTLAQAAAHEAGHVLVGAALGDSGIAAKLYRSRVAARLMGEEVWLGATHRENRQFTGAVFSLDASAERLVYEALNMLAGVVGEIEAELHHPASSLDEVLVAQQSATVIADRLNIEPELVFGHLYGVCLQTIVDNRRQFDVLRGHLVRRRRLTTGETSRMLRGIQMLSIPGLLPSGVMQ